MNFNNKFHIYNANADIQRLVAHKLNNFISYNCKEKQFKSIFEIGCGTGIFTSYITKSYNFDNIILNDYFDTRKYLTNIKYSNFLFGDIETIAIPEVDIVVSSSVLQWIKNFDLLVNKVNKNTNLFAFSIFTLGNLKEINDHFKISLNYMQADTIETTLKKYFKIVNSETQTLKKKFNTPFDALRHLKNTGVTGFKKASISSIRSFSDTTLTYEVAYFYCSN